MPTTTEYDIDLATIASLPTLHLDLLTDIIEWAEAGDRAEKMPEFSGWGRWSQGSWGQIFNRTPHDVTLNKRVKPDSQGGVCGSAYCVAGQAAVQSGYRLNYPEGETLWGEDAISVDDCIPQRPTDRVDKRGFTIWEDIPNVKPAPIPGVGRRALGLTPDEAQHLFGGENSIDRLKEWTNLFADVRGLGMPYPDHGIPDYMESYPTRIRALYERPTMTAEEFDRNV